MKPKILKQQGLAFFQLSSHLFSFGSNAIGAESYVLFGSQLLVQKHAESLGHRLETHPGIGFSSLWPSDSACFRSEEHTSELQSHVNLVCRLLLEKKKTARLGLQSIQVGVLRELQPRDPHAADVHQRFRRVAAERAAQRRATAG